MEGGFSRIRKETGGRNVDVVFYHEHLGDLAPVGKMHDHGRSLGEFLEPRDASRVDVEPLGAVAEPLDDLEPEVLGAMRVDVDLGREPFRHARQVQGHAGVAEVVDGQHADGSVAAIFVAMAEETVKSKKVFRGAVSGVCKAG